MSGEKLENLLFVFITVSFAFSIINGAYVLFSSNNKFDNIYGILFVGFWVFLFLMIRSSEKNRQKRRGVPDECIGCIHIKQRKNYYSDEYSRSYRIEYSCDKKGCNKRTGGFVATRSDYKYYQENNKSNKNIATDLKSKGDNSQDIIKLKRENENKIRRDKLKDEINNLHAEIVQLNQEKEEVFKNIVDLNCNVNNKTELQNLIQIHKDEYNEYMDYNINKRNYTYNINDLTSYKDKLINILKEKSIEIQKLKNKLEISNEHKRINEIEIKVKEDIKKIYEEIRQLNEEKENIINKIAILDEYITIKNKSKTQNQTYRNNTIDSRINSLSYTSNIERLISTKEEFSKIKKEVYVEIETYKNELEKKNELYEMKKIIRSEIKVLKVGDLLIHEKFGEMKMISIDKNYINIITKDYLHKSFVNDDNLYKYISKIKKQTNQ